MCVFALAAEVGGKRLLHLVLVALHFLAGDAARRLHALAIDQLHLAARRQAAVATQHGIVLRLLGSILVPALLLEHGVALLALDQLDGNALAHAFIGAPDVLLQALHCRCARKAQGEILLLIHSVPGLRRNVFYLGAAGLKLIAFRTRQQGSRHGFEGFIDLRGTAHARRQRVGKIKNPFLVAIPAPRAFGGIGIAAAQGDWGLRLGVAQPHRRVVHLHNNLANLGHIALRAELTYANSMGTQGAHAKKCAQAPGPGACTDPGWCGPVRHHF